MRNKPMIGGQVYLDMGTDNKTVRVSYRNKFKSGSDLNASSPFPDVVSRSQTLALHVRESGYPKKPFII